MENNNILSCKPVITHPVNKGLACIKGRNIAYQNSMEYRVTTPLLRDETGKMNPISWEKAYEIIAEKFIDINNKYGRGSLAFLSTGQIPLEEMAILGYVGRFGLGMEGDGNTRLCMATAAVFYNQSFGFDAPPYSWNDLMTTELAIFIGANPAISHPVPWWRLRKENKDAEIVVIDPRKTETTKEADLFLPTATSLEKEGTFINTERRLGAVQKMVEPPEGIKSDYEIILEIGKALGLNDKLKLDKWKTPKDAFNLMKAISEGMPCDITGVEYDNLKNSNGVQWPLRYKENLENDYRILFEDYNFYTENKKGKFIFETPQEYPELPNEQYPFYLITGRGGVGLWHTLTRTRNMPIVQHTYPKEDYLLISQQDADNLKVKDEDLVSVSSKNGNCNIKVKISDEVVVGQVFISMHYNVANRLTDSLYDPYSKEPSYKYATVSIKKI